MRKYLLLLIFLILNSSLIVQNSFSQWVQQSVPVTAGYFNDMKFVNANTGFIAHYSYPVGTFLKTTNAGYNWTVNLNAQIQNISVVDSLNLYCTVNRGLYDKLFKTTNCGITWDSSLSTQNYLAYLYFFNKDTGMISIGDGTNNYIARITDGGQSYQILATYGGAPAGKFFFLKEKVNGEYYGWMYYPSYPSLYRTTNSGLNWIQLPSFSNNLYSLFFVNKDTGWATITQECNYVYYTNNGGLNWSLRNLSYTALQYDIFFINPNTGWVGFGSHQRIYITTNAGTNWGTQLVNGTGSAKLSFLDSLYGWAQTSWNTIARTTNGGGPITSIISGSTETQKDYRLYQNYPNPFNPTTVIRYQLSIVSEVSLKVFDVQGREVQTLVNETLKPGTYEATFDGSALASGIYFYKIIATGESTNQTFTETRKMMVIK